VALAGSSYIYSRPASAPLQFQGWIEADLIFVSPDEVGRIVNMSVQEGQTVAVGDPIFELDDELQRAAVAENEAAVANARVAFDRAQALLKRNVGSQKAFDDAEAALRTAEARLNSAKTHLDRRRVVSPVAGTVQEIYFRTGEMVQAGRPIVSIMPPGNIKVRFFVPQATLPKISIGKRIAIQCDGCDRDLRAQVFFISAQAEFTPPIIYSQEERARLVFRIEARPETPQNLRTGQPVSVFLTASTATDHARRE
jgi:HlyD family secretion protein